MSGVSGICVPTHVVVVLRLATALLRTLTDSAAWLVPFLKILKCATLVLVLLIALFLPGVPGESALSLVVEEHTVVVEVLSWPWPTEVLLAPQSLVLRAAICKIVPSTASSRIGVAGVPAPLSAAVVSTLGIALLQPLLATVALRAHRLRTRRLATQPPVLLTARFLIGVRGLLVPVAVAVVTMTVAAV